MTQAIVLHETSGPEKLQYESVDSVAAAPRLWRPWKSCGAEMMYECDIAILEAGAMGLILGSHLGTRVPKTVPSFEGRTEGHVVLIRRAIGPQSIESEEQLGFGLVNVPFIFSADWLDGQWSRGILLPYVRSKSGRARVRGLGQVVGRN